MKGIKKYLLSFVILWLIACLTACTNGAVRLLDRASGGYQEDASPNTADSGTDDSPDNKIVKFEYNGKQDVNTEDQEAEEDVPESVNDSSDMTVTGDTGEIAEPGAETWSSYEIENDTKPVILEEGEYTSRDEVAEYIHIYGHLPGNFITKNDAKQMGWDSGSNYLSDVAPGKSIGGDRFMNYEGKLPEENGRKYYECDIDYTGGKRGAKRIVYSNDGLVFYSSDHYNSFEAL